MDSQPDLNSQPNSNSVPKLADEIEKMEYEPLLPVEKSLIGWSIGLGIALLCILIWVSNKFF